MGSLKNSRSPIRIGFVLHAMELAGAEVLVTEIIRLLAGKVHSTVYCLDKVGALGHRLRDEGIKVVCLERSPGWDLKLAQRLARAAREDRIELVHAHQYTPFFYAALARALTGLSFALLFTEHGRKYPDLVSPLRRAVNRVFLDGLANEVNAVANCSRRALCRVDGFAGNRIEVIANGVHVERFASNGRKAEARQRLGLDPRRRYIIHVARFHPVKAQDTLIQAYKIVAENESDVDLLLLGDGPLAGPMATLAKSLGLHERVRFLGARDNVPDFLHAADVFVLTSVSEAAPCSLLEAMAAEVPIVATAVGGVPDMVQHGVQGLLVPAGEAHEIAAALLQILEDPAGGAAMGRAGAALVNSRYRIEDMVEHYYRVYCRLTGRGGNCVHG